MQQIDVVIPVYNGAAHLLDSLQSVFAQELPDGWIMRVYVVDDASTDDSQALVRATFPGARIVALISNQGRSIARNQGAAAGRGELLCFLDSDCQYVNTSALAGYIKSLTSGADVAFGPLHTDSPGFWGRYQREVYARRRTKAEKGDVQVMTSSNFALQRCVFEAIQGFCTDYSRYGFEDYDLLQRLVRARYEVMFCDDIVASHGNDDTLYLLCEKMAISSQHSAPLFMQQYGDVYAAMPYAKVDARLRPVLRFLNIVCAPLLPVLVNVGERIVNWRLPYLLRKTYVQAVMALAYLKGSAQKIK